MQPSIDPDLAVRNEFVSLEAKGTIEAYELFIARHPGHVLAEEARRRLEEMRKAAKDGQP